ncbi:hypothetical protein SARC_11216 [Sphaeroforma arctica JP610]|uniref:GATA-type domain-containing protein n=1 Tax=Sphaeroforma arctica JP610 TaxID=667725 RepID=A0A0L0FHP5_9EUKA|nr:hypothetical protein SARC_11216 [Sphaeroforma arctica JP610]KNC76275.1 hypothetical protein SARC_11216 [Sphaeroforma arctica JP610]|eukprot:XP_014150177.1 hypothetical protein SARC_11216 [Sphaeroforma arctica JP610]
MALERYNDAHVTMDGGQITNSHNHLSVVHNMRQHDRDHEVSTRNTNLKPSRAYSHDTKNSMCGPCCSSSYSNTTANRQSGIGCNNRCYPIDNRNSSHNEVQHSQNFHDGVGDMHCGTRQITEGFAHPYDQKIGAAHDCGIYGCDCPANYTCGHSKGNNQQRNGQGQGQMRISLGNHSVASLLHTNTAPTAERDGEQTNGRIYQYSTNIKLEEDREGTHEHRNRSKNNNRHRSRDTHFQSQADVYQQQNNNVEYINRIQERIGDASQLSPRQRQSVHVENRWPINGPNTLYTVAVGSNTRHRGGSLVIGNNMDQDRTSNLSEVRSTENNMPPKPCSTCQQCMCGYPDQTQGLVNYEQQRVPSTQESVNQQRRNTGGGAYSDQHVFDHQQNVMFDRRHTTSCATEVAIPQHSKFQNNGGFNNRFQNQNQQNQPSMRVNTCNGSMPMEGPNYIVNQAPPCIGHSRHIGKTTPTGHIIHPFSTSHPEQMSAQRSGSGYSDSNVTQNTHTSVQRYSQKQSVARNDSKYHTHRIPSQNRSASFHSQSRTTDDSGSATRMQKIQVMQIVQAETSNEGSDSMESNRVLGSSNNGSFGCSQAKKINSRPNPLRSTHSRSLSYSSEGQGSTADDNDKSSGEVTATDGRRSEGDIQQKNGHRKRTAEGPNMPSLRSERTKNHDGSAHKRNRTDNVKAASVDPSLSSQIDSDKTESDLKSTEETTVAAPAHKVNKKRTPVVREDNPCSHCGITESCTWRPGPLGRSTLCNTCGYYFRRRQCLSEKRKDLYRTTSQLGPEAAI